MYVKIQTSGKGENKGSCSDYADYLEKENIGKDDKEKEYFFSAEKDKVEKFEVINEIDNNKRKLGKEDAKFFSVTISPSEKELKHIMNDSNKLKEYTRAVMDEYAKNFKREGINSGKDLVYFAKVEHERTYKGTDKEVRTGEFKQGELKKGNQTHIHVIVSRKDRKNKIKLSPLANEKGNNKSVLNGKSVQRGFDRSAFKTTCEQKFDKQFNYERNFKETFEYSNKVKKASIDERLTTMDMDVKEKVLEKTLEMTLEKAQKNIYKSQDNELEK